MFQIIRIYEDLKSFCIQCLDIVKMYKYTKFDQIIPWGSRVMSIFTIRIARILKYWGRQELREYSSTENIARILKYWEYCENTQVLRILREYSSTENIARILKYWEYCENTQVLRILREYSSTENIARILKYWGRQLMRMMKTSTSRNDAQRSLVLHTSGWTINKYAKFDPNTMWFKGNEHFF